MSNDKKTKNVISVDFTNEEDGKEKGFKASINSTEGGIGGDFEVKTEDTIYKKKIKVDKDAFKNPVEKIGNFLVKKLKIEKTENKPVINEKQETKKKQKRNKRSKRVVC